MADLIRRNQSDLSPTRGDLFPQPFGGWDPFQSMRELLSWDPLSRWGRGFPHGELASFAPAFDLTERADAFVLEADLPGVREEELDVSVTGNRLTVAGRRESERRDEGDQRFVVERSYGAFTRSFALPEGCDADQISAELREGVLTVVIPKTAPQPTRRISLKGLKERFGGKHRA